VRMNKWNFNVTVPLWDLVKGTYLRDENDPKAARAAAAVASER